MAPPVRSLVVQLCALSLVVVIIIGIGLSAMQGGADGDGPGENARHPQAAGSRGDDGHAKAAAPAATDLGKTRPAEPAPPLEGVGNEDVDEVVSPLPVQPVVAGAANPQVASVVEAARTGTHPERRTALAMPAPFDAAAYGKDPQAYLDVCEPGRVFQPAQPGADVVQLGAKSPQYVELADGGSTGLAVRAVPGAPVTFTSFDLGSFSNRLTSITVRANAEGVATATFKAVGTVNDCNIMAASPLCSGQVTFMVFVPQPAPPSISAAPSVEAAGDIPLPPAATRSSSVD